MNRTLIAICTVTLSVVGNAACLTEACTLEAVSSVNGTVVDADGNQRGDVEVTYRVDGGRERSANCFTSAGCGKFSAGSEEAGTFEITATSLDGADTATVVVEVQDGGCHVESENVEIVL